MITPNSNVYLCNTKLSKTQDHQIRFTSRAAQSAYFAALAVYTQDNLTFTRKDEVLRVPYHIDELWQVNYCMYNNLTIANKWFYAFIDRMEYVGESATNLYLTTDVYQTWMQDCQFLASFTEREHTITDVIGEHTIPESFELGEPIKAVQTDWDELDALATIVLISAVKAGAGSPEVPANLTPVAGRVYNGIFSGLAAVPFYGTGWVESLRAYIKDFADVGIPDAIVAIYTYPVNLLPPGTSSGSAIGSDSSLSTFIDTSITINGTTINGYTPKNNKLFCWPFNFLHVTNLQGQSIDLKLELFDTGYPAAVTYTCKGVMQPGAKVIAYPLNYKVHENWNYEEALTLPNYPLCSWTSDVWASWIAANAIGIGASVAGAGLSIASSLATGNPIGTAAGFISVTNTISEVYKKSIEPPSVGGNFNNSSVNVAAGAQHFTFMQMQIRAEYASIIDEYFTMFGYKVNRVKVPALSGRTYYNYVKTINANITGPVPAADLQRLRQLFDNGITLWHSGANLGNYALDNSL